MTVAFEKTAVDSLTPGDYAGLAAAYPQLRLGEPVLYEDDAGTEWYCYSDGRWDLEHVAILASMAANLQSIVEVQAQYIEDGEVVDRKAWHEEAKGLLTDTSVVDYPMTLPEDVTPSDPEADRPSLEDVRAAQEKNDGDLDDKMLVSVDRSAWTRVEEEVS